MERWPEPSWACGRAGRPGNGCFRIRAGLGPQPLRPGRTHPGGKAHLPAGGCTVWPACLQPVQVMGAEKSLFKHLAGHAPPQARHHLRIRRDRIGRKLRGRRPGSGRKAVHCRPAGRGRSRTFCRSGAIAGKPPERHQAEGTKIRIRFIFNARPRSNGI